MNEDLVFDAKVNVTEPINFSNEPLLIPFTIAMNIPCSLKNKGCFKTLIAASCLVLVLLIALIAFEVHLRKKKLV